MKDFETAPVARQTYLFSLSLQKIWLKDSQKAIISNLWLYCGVKYRNQYFVDIWIAEQFWQVEIQNFILFQLFTTNPFSSDYYLASMKSLISFIIVEMWMNLGPIYQIDWKCIYPFWTAGIFSMANIKWGKLKINRNRWILVFVKTVTLLINKTKAITITMTMTKTMTKT